MRNQIVLFVFLIVSAWGFSQTKFKISLDSLGFQKPTFLLDKLKSWQNSPFLEIAAKSYEINLDSSTEYQVQLSILNYDLKPMKSRPDIIFSDANQFRLLYEKANPAFYEALKNTTYSQIYNPFSLHKSL
jgi:hypothetical protein